MSPARPSTKVHLIQQLFPKDRPDNWPWSVCGFNAALTDDPAAVTCKLCLREAAQQQRAQQRRAAHR
jgi:hypothetical protein